MSKRKKTAFIVIIILAALLFISLSLLTLYYYPAFETTLNLFHVANNGEITDFSGSNIVSVENFNKLCGITHRDNNGTYLVDGGTFFFPRVMKTRYIEFSCTSNYRVRVFETDRLVEKVLDRKLIVVMQNVDLKWIVTEVRIIDNGIRQFPSLTFKKFTH